MNDAICVRDITREPLAAGTCISGSRCVTRLIKIPRDLLRRARAAEGNGARKGEKRERGGREGEERRTNERGRCEWTYAEEERRWRRVRATHSAAALSSTHVVSTQFAMKYRGDHRPCADDHNGLPALNRLPHATSAFAVLHFDLSLTVAPFLLPFVLSTSTLYPRHSYFFESPVSRGARGGKKSAVSNEEKFIRGASRATIALIRLNLNTISISLSLSRVHANPLLGRRYGFT